MAIRKSPAVEASQATPGMMVRIVEPNGAGLPEAMAKGGGEMYAKGAYGKVITTPMGGLGVKVHPTALHDMQTHGYFKLTGATVVEQIEFDHPNDLLNLAAEQLNAFTEQAQPLMNATDENSRFAGYPMATRTQIMEAAISSVTFEHDRLADMIEAAGFELDKEIQAPIRNYGEGRLEREAERQRQMEAEAARTFDGDDSDDDEEDENDRGEGGNTFGIGGENYNPTATVTPLRPGTTDADGVVTLDAAAHTEIGEASDRVVSFTREDGDTRSVGLVVLMGEARDGEPVDNQGHDAYIPAGMPSIPAATVDVRTNHADTVASISADVAPAAETLDSITAADLGIGSNIPDADAEEEGEAPRA